MLFRPIVYNIEMKLSELTIHAPVHREGDKINPVGVRKGQSPWHIGQPETGPLGAANRAYNCWLTNPAQAVLEAGVISAPVATIDTSKFPLKYLREGRFAEIKNMAELNDLAVIYLPAGYVPKKSAYRKALDIINAGNNPVTKSPEAHENSKSVTAYLETQTNDLPYLPPADDFRDYEKQLATPDTEDQPVSRWDRIKRKFLVTFDNAVTNSLPY